MDKLKKLIIYLFKIVFIIIVIESVVFSVKTANISSAVKISQYGYLFTPEFVPAESITTGLLPNGTLKSVIEINYYFKWNSKYAQPGKFVAKLVVNNKEYNCNTTFIKDSFIKYTNSYYIYCNMIIYDKVDNSRIEIYADNIKIIEKELVVS